MITRIYVVIDKATSEKRLIEATSAAQAIRHCVANKYSAKPATPKEIAQFMTSGLTVEKAGLYDVPEIPASSTSVQQHLTKP